MRTHQCNTSSDSSQQCNTSSSSPFQQSLTDSDYGSNDSINHLPHTPPFPDIATWIATSREDVWRILEKVVYLSRFHDLRSEMRHLIPLRERFQIEELEFLKALYFMRLTKKPILGFIHLLWFNNWDKHWDKYWDKPKRHEIRQLVRFKHLVLL